jgi:hypothetical protein
MQEPRWNIGTINLACIVIESRNHSSNMSAKNALEMINSSWTPLFYGSNKAENKHIKEDKSVTYKNCGIYAIGFWNSGHQTMEIIFVTMAKDPEQSIIQIRNGGKGEDTQEEKMIRDISNCGIEQRRCYYFSILKKDPGCCVADILEEMGYKTQFNNYSHSSYSWDHPCVIS